MYRGKKNCRCGSFFIFETVRDWVECFQCKKRYDSSEIGNWVKPENEDGENDD